MIVTLTGVSKGRNGASLPETSLSFGSGAVTVAAAETERRPSVLSLIASGRMKPDTGGVTIDGERANRRLRASVAIIDAPDVCEPVPDVTLAGVVAEELMFAGRPSHPIATKQMLAELGAEQLGKLAITDVPALERVRLLSELALLREGVDGLVITAPDRHGGDPLGWFRVASDLADRGYAVLVVVGTAGAKAVADAAVDEAVADADTTAGEADAAVDESAENTTAEAEADAPTLKETIGDSTAAADASGTDDTSTPTSAPQEDGTPPPPPVDAPENDAPNDTTETAREESAR